MTSTESALTAPVDPPQPVSPRATPAAIIIAVIAAAILLIVPITTTVVAGQTPYDLLISRFPGLAVAVATTTAHVFAETAAAITMGAIIWVLFLRDAGRRAAFALTDSFELRVARIASLGWLVGAAAMVLMESLDSSGYTLDQLAEPGVFGFLFSASDFPKAWAVSFVAAVICFLGTWFATRWTGLLIPLWAGTIGVLAPVVVGQILVGPDHDLGSDSGAIQTVTAMVAFGLIAVAALRLGFARGAAQRRIPVPSLRRLGRVLLVALPVLFGTELLLTWFKLAGTPITDSVTGLQELARLAVLLLVIIVIGVAALRWRRGTLTSATITTSITVAALGAATWIALGVAMARIPPPHYFVPTSITQVILGFDLPLEPTPVVLATAWRLNLLILVIAIAAVTTYLVAVSILRRRGDRWPVGRTIAWVLGWVVAVVSTSSGLGRYSGADFGIHMIVHMSLNMLAPILLVLGGIITLLLRASRPNQPVAGLHEWITWVMHWRVLQVIYNPLVVFALFVGSYYALYLSGLFGEAMTYHWAHQVMNLHFLIVGYLYYSLVVGVDRPPKPLPHIGKLGFVLAAMPFHAFFGVVLMTTQDIIAGNLYRSLNLPWADLQASQYLGGGVAWAGGELPLMVVIVVLAIQWSRQDSREAKRIDRHFDTGRDDEFENYNRMLDALAARRAGRGGLTASEAETASVAPSTSTPAAPATETEAPR